MTLEVTTIAWDNESKYFNEFETFPLQVKAMTDMDAFDGAYDVQLRFAQYVDENTCLKIPHKNKDSLPQKCGGEYRSLTKLNREQASIAHPPARGIMDWIIPQANARLDVGAEAEESQVTLKSLDDIEGGMLINEALPYDTYKKLEDIGNEQLKLHVMFATNPATEKFIEHEQSQ